MKFFSICILYLTFIALHSGCTENTVQSEEDKFLGTWGLGRSLVKYPDSTKEEKIGTDIPFTYYIFKSNGILELFETQTEIANSNNSWKIENNKLTLAFFDNTQKIWNYIFEKDTLILSMVQSETNTTYERAFARRKNVIDSKIVGSWELQAKIIQSDTGEIDESPSITNIYETLTFQDNGSFTEVINDNGNLSTLNGSWSALLNECIIYRYPSGLMKLRLYSLDDIDFPLTIEWSFNQNNLVYRVLTGYKKK